jgi:hypothetical protein
MRVSSAHAVDGEALNMELDKAFEYAVITAWEDFEKISAPCSVRVEYQCEPGAPLDHVGVWSTGADGHQKLVCDYWTSESLNHDGGMHFSNGYGSQTLATALDFIMTNQGRFTRRAGAGRDGLALIYPPAADDRAEAGNRLRAMEGIHADAGGGEAPWAPPSAYSQLERRAPGPSS